MAGPSRGSLSLEHAAKYRIIKWRAAATAYAQNCNGPSCDTDVKRVTVKDSAHCAIP